MRAITVLALSILMVTAGCGGFIGTPDNESTVSPELGDTPTATERSTITPSSTIPLPPGVTPGAEEEVNEWTVVSTHNRVLENRSVTWQSQQFLTNSSGTVLRWSTSIVQSKGSYQRFEKTKGGADSELVRTGGPTHEYWTNGNVTVSRMRFDNGSVKLRTLNGSTQDSLSNTRAGRDVLESVILGSDLQYVGVERRNGTAFHILTSTGKNNQLTVRVTPGGVIRSFVYRGYFRLNGENVTDVRRFRIYDVGNTEVKKPDWAANVTTNNTVE